ncbi:Uncharacterised protein [Escherichia coli]|nr:Uncharacterised protein [Escherichia coli]CAD5735031.1 Uncharacterised protein [Escherichia coli]CAD5877960.1 Uncharacterised protein [Escherichia coli]CTS57618.1 Uncharacterised protein [Escherichia coli]CTU31918.1 Uncharacterised protein [Escherichia coli]
MLGGADNPNGELPSYITGADTYGSFKLVQHAKFVIFSVNTGERDHRLSQAIRDEPGRCR